MNSTLETLLVLQERDQRVNHLTRELSHLPAELASLEAERARRNAAFEAKRVAARQIEADRRKLELEVKSKETAIDRYKTQQQQTRKNEEFSALNHEISHLQSEIVKLEDEELILMERYEVAQAQLKVAQTELNAYLQTAAEKTAEIQRRRTNLESELVQAKERQRIAEEKTNPDDVAKYRRIMKSKGDSVIVPVRHQVCSGCHMKVTSQTWITAHKEYMIANCENCGRMLFCDE